MRQVLRCANCGREYPAELGRYLCDDCPSEAHHGLTVRRGLLEVVHDLDDLRGTLTRASLGAHGSGVWAFREILPDVDERDIVTLGEGATPLLKAEKLGADLGLEHLFLKVETGNPTGAFKDRETSVAISVGRTLGANAVACASTGSIAVSGAAYAARAGLPAFLFVPAGTSREKVVSMLANGATVIAVEAIYERALALETQACREFGWYDLSCAVNPYRAEGDKTTAFEIMRQLDWTVPDWVMVPTGGGGQLSGLWKGFTDLYLLGLIPRRPKLAAVGTAAGAPLARAFQGGLERVEPLEVGETIAGALLSAYTDYGAVALRAVRDSGGTALAVTDEELVASQLRLARQEGVFGEASAAAGVVGAALLASEGVIRESDRVVCLITGSGFREIAAVQEHVGGPKTLPGSWDEVRAFIEAAGTAARILPAR